MLAHPEQGFRNPLRVDLVGEHLQFAVPEQLNGDLGFPNTPLAGDKTFVNQRDKMCTALDLSTDLVFPVGLTRVTVVVRVVKNVDAFPIPQGRNEQSSKIILCAGITYEYLSPEAPQSQEIVPGLPGVIEHGALGINSAQRRGHLSY